MAIPMPPNFRVMLWVGNHEKTIRNQQRWFVRSKEMAEKNVIASDGHLPARQRCARAVASMRLAAPLNLLQDNVKLIELERCGDTNRSLFQEDESLLLTGSFPTRSNNRSKKSSVEKGLERRGTVRLRAVLPASRRERRS